MFCPRAYKALFDKGRAISGLHKATQQNLQRPGCSLEAQIMRRTGIPQSSHRQLENALAPASLGLSSTSSFLPGSTRCIPGPRGRASSSVALGSCPEPRQHEFSEWPSPPEGPGGRDELFPRPPCDTAGWRETRAARLVAPLLLLPFLRPGVCVLVRTAGHSCQGHRAPKHSTVHVCRDAAPKGHGPGS